MSLLVLQTITHKLVELNHIRSSLTSELLTDPVLIQIHALVEPLL